MHHKLLVYLVTILEVLSFTLVASPAPTSNSRELDLPVLKLDQSWRVTSYVQDPGLTGIDFTGMAFEKDGTAWVASNNGLFRYDGYHWTRFTVQNGLPSSYIRCVHITKSGQLWVGTAKGAGVFDIRSFVTHGSEKGLAAPSVRRIREDPDGTLWFVSDSYPNPGVPGGLTSFRDGVWTVYKEKDGLPSDQLTDYFRDSQGRQFALTEKGFAQKQGAIWIDPLRTQGLRNELVWAMMESPQLGLMAVLPKALIVRQGDRWTKKMLPPGKEMERVSATFGNTRWGDLLHRRRRVCWNANLPMGREEIRSSVRSRCSKKLGRRSRRGSGWRHLDLWQSSAQPLGTSKARMDRIFKCSCPNLDR